jgi:hypothetical protein
MITFYPPINKIIKINQFQIVDVKISLFEKANFRVLLYDTDGKLTDNKFFELNTEEYLQWNSDDRWLINYVKSRLQDESQNQT